MPYIIVSVIITGIVSIIVAVINLYPSLFPPNVDKHEPGPRPETGHLEGILTDRNGNPIINIPIGILRGPQTRTDIEGKFVLTEVPVGDQLIVIKPQVEKSQVTQNVHIERAQPNRIKIYYDPASSLLGLLSIIAPVEGGELEARKVVQDDGTRYRATVYGRCDGLERLLERFNVWVLVSSNNDQKLWVQPPAIIDRTSSTWQAEIFLGDADFVPRPEDRWRMVAVAAEADSQIGRVLNTPNLSLLPHHVSSNVVVAKAVIRE